MQRMRRFRLSIIWAARRMRFMRECVVCMQDRPTARENDMDLSIRTPNLALDAGEVITVDDAEGLRIVARRGTVWVTEEGDSVDHIVGPGDPLIVAHPRPTVVQDLQPAGSSLAVGSPPATDNHWNAAAQ